MPLGPTPVEGMKRKQEWAEQETDYDTAQGYLISGH